MVGRVVPGVLLTGLLLTGCGDGSGAGEGASTATGTSAPSTSASPTTTESAPETSTPGEAVGTEDAVAAVRAWLTAVSTGDLAAARASLGAWSRTAADQLGGLESLASGLAEGMAAFTAEGVRWDAVAVPGTDAVLVTAAGEVEREGMREVDARAWLVHPEGGQDVVEVFSAPPAEVTAPQDGELTATVPTGTVVVVVDGELTEDGVSTTADGDVTTVRVAPDGGWSGGRHVVTVASLPATADAAGPWATAAVTFEG